MKRIKFFNRVCLVVIILTASCVEPEDLVTENAKEGGALLSSAGSDGKLLGVEDPETGVVSYTDTDMALKVSLVSGRFNNESFTLVKQYNGQEVEVEDFDELPYEYSINSIDDFLEGFTGVTQSDLRIGDVIAYRIKIHLKDGSVVVSNDAKLDVKVNCGSDLAGTYTMTGLYSRPASGIVNSPVGPKDDVVTKIGTNLYATTYTGHWNPVSDLGLATCPLIFTVECGVITIPTQYLCDAYGNQPSGTGYVDEDGNLHFEYQITGGNLRTYTFDYIKQ